MCDSVGAPASVDTPKREYNPSAMECMKPGIGSGVFAVGGLMDVAGGFGSGMCARYGVRRGCGRAGDRDSCPGAEPVSVEFIPCLLFETPM